jgi:hypothetical protein
MKGLILGFVSIIMLTVSPLSLAKADTKKPTADQWYCTERNGTRYCYRNGEACKLVKLPNGTSYWMCDGPMRTARRVNMGGTTLSASTRP